MLSVKSEPTLPTRLVSRTVTSHSHKMLKSRGPLIELATKVREGFTIMEKGLLLAKLGRQCKDHKEGTGGLVRSLIIFVTESGV